ncbi:hypothetical protein M405DRAFT_862986 [Rhizopogon salebrosus TDB-379]|nr:hypothetical protein M405DRAFT_862986 [Rhizopogon salebrosus TDB-379]
MTLSYVGAVSVQDGLPAAASWISKLLKPDDPPPALMDGSGSRPTSTSPPLVRVQAQTSGTSSTATAPPPYYPNAPQVAASPTPPPAVPLGTLAIFNQTCSQLRFSLEWNSSSNGPQHDPRWEVECMVNGVERGSGLGRNQNRPKEIAAYQAYHQQVQEPEPTTA